MPVKIIMTEDAVVCYLIFLSLKLANENIYVKSKLCYLYYYVANFTRCEIDLLRSRGWEINGVAAAVFTPSCRPDGSYVPEQCDKAVGQCWCVDSYGNELVASRVNGRANCTSQCKFSCSSIGVSFTSLIYVLLLLRLAKLVSGF